MKPRIILLLLLLIAAFVRLWRIDDFTQFRGDQGSAGIILYEALKNRQLPLVGPTVSTGQLPGPAYYYIIALPLILSRFNPLLPAVMFAIFGIATVFLLYYLANRMFGTPAAIAVAAMYALSPAVIRMDQTMWNPTAIPFLVTLMLFCLYKVHEDKKPAFILLTSFCLGILVQLHYTNALWIPPIVLWWAYKSRNLRWLLFSTAAFLLPLSPFLYYEFQHQFIDFRELISVFLHPPPRGEAGPRFIGRLQYVLTRTFFTPFPRLTQLPTIVTGFILLAVPFFKRKSAVSVILSAFATLIIILLSWYKGPFFDHYLWFFLPIPFFLAGSFIAFVIPKKFQFPVVTLGIALMLYFYVPKLELTKPKIGDIERTQTVANAILKDSKGEPFSFGLISSFSYTDLHYRYFFHIRNADPLPVLDTTYKTLYLVCEGEQCPPFPHLNIQSMKEIRVYCYDHVCKGEYPVIDLTKFKHYPYAPESKVIAGATLYIYRR